MLSNPFDRHELVRYDVKQVREIYICHTLCFFIYFCVTSLSFLIVFIVVLFQVVCSVCDTEQPVCVFLCWFQSKLNKRAKKNDVLVLIFFDTCIGFRLHESVQTAASVWGNISVKFGNSTTMM